MTNSEEDRSLTIKSNYFDPIVWGQMKEMSQVFFTSHAIPSYIANAPQLMMIIQAGYEMGMKPLEAMKSLYMVNGSINLWGSALIRRLREHGWVVAYKMSTENEGTCVATVSKDKETYSESYSFSSAEKSGYTKDSKGSLKVGWRVGVNRNLKLRYGAISMIIKSYIPEVLGSASDVAEIVEDYPIIESEPTKPVTKGEKIVSGNGNLEEFINAKKAEKNVTKIVNDDEPAN
jgi:hypothetical protein